MGGGVFILCYVFGKLGSVKLCIEESTFHGMSRDM